MAMVFGSLGGCSPSCVSNGHDDGDDDARHAGRSAAVLAVRRTTAAQNARKMASLSVPARPSARPPARLTSFNPAYDTDDSEYIGHGTYGCVILMPLKKDTTHGAGATTLAPMDSAEDDDCGGGGEFDRNVYNNNKVGGDPPCEAIAVRVEITNSKEASRAAKLAHTVASEMSEIGERRHTPFAARVYKTYRIDAGDAIRGELERRFLLRQTHSTRATWARHLMAPWWLPEACLARLMDDGDSDDDSDSSSSNDGSSDAVDGDVMTRLQNAMVDVSVRDGSVSRIVQSLRDIDVFVMESQLGAHDLANRIDAQAMQRVNTQTSGSRLSFGFSRDELRCVVFQLFAGVQLAYDRIGLVHLDLKPENYIVMEARGTSAESIRTTRFVMDGVADDGTTVTRAYEIRIGTAEARKALDGLEKQARSDRDRGREASMLSSGLASDCFAMDETIAEAEQYRKSIRERAQQQQQQQQQQSGDHLLTPSSIRAIDTATPPCDNMVSYTLCPVDFGNASTRTTPSAHAGDSLELSACTTVMFVEPLLLMTYDPTTPDELPGERGTDADMWALACMTLAMGACGWDYQAMYNGVPTVDDCAGSPSSSLLLYDMRTKRGAHRFGKASLVHMIYCTPGVSAVVDEIYDAAHSEWRSARLCDLMRERGCSAAEAERLLETLTSGETRPGQVFTKDRIRASLAMCQITYALNSLRLPRQWEDDVDERNHDQFMPSHDDLRARGIGAGFYYDQMKRHFQRVRNLSTPSSVVNPFWPRARRDSKVESMASDRTVYQLAVEYAYRRHGDAFISFVRRAMSWFGDERAHMRLAPASLKPELSSSPRPALAPSPAPVVVEYRRARGGGGGGGGDGDISHNHQQQQQQQRRRRQTCDEQCATLRSRGRYKKDCECMSPVQNCARALQHRYFDPLLMRNHATVSVERSRDDNNTETYILTA